MNEYKLMLPPFEYKDFRGLSKKQAEEYFQWYIGQTDLRIRQLWAYIQSTGKNNFSCEYTPESLVGLWEWFEPHIYLEEKNSEDFLMELSKTPEWLHSSIPKEEFTTMTLALIVDISFYFAKTFIMRNPNIVWGYFTKPKNEVSVNMPVLLGFKSNMKLDPRRIVSVCARKSYRESNPNRLFDIYNVWTGYIAGNVSEC